MWVRWKSWGYPHGFGIEIPLTYRWFLIACSPCLYVMVKALSLCYWQIYRLGNIIRIFHYAYNPCLMVTTTFSRICTKYFPKGAPTRQNKTNATSTIKVIVKTPVGRLKSNTCDKINHDYYYRITFQNYMFINDQDSFLFFLYLLVKCVVLIVILLFF